MHFWVNIPSVLVAALTKRMSEDLTDYYSEAGVKVRYLHSDIHTVERVEILRDLRLGTFDVLIGINLLREGLDLPEVSLVAILDADKEGFLRSERSLVQTIGRAARNLHGRAILYGDKITKSMKKAIDETNRRRVKQEAYNTEHNITPTGIQKSIESILGADQDDQKPMLAALKSQITNEKLLNILALSPKAFEKKVEGLEKDMLVSAKDLDFEKAAALRDRVTELKRQYFLREG